MLLPEMVGGRGDGGGSGGLEIVAPLITASVACLELSSFCDEK